MKNGEHYISIKIAADVLRQQGFTAKQIILAALPLHPSNRAEYYKAMREILNELTLNEKVIR